MSKECHRIDKTLWRASVRSDHSIKKKEEKQKTKQTEVRFITIEPAWNFFSMLQYVHLASIGVPRYIVLIYYSSILRTKR